jgi:hypothetical protein
MPKKKRNAEVDVPVKAYSVNVLVLFRKTVFRDCELIRFFRVEPSSHTRRQRLSPFLSVAHL